MYPCGCPFFLNSPVQNCLREGRWRDEAGRGGRPRRAKPEGPRHAWRGRSPEIFRCSRDDIGKQLELDPPGGVTPDGHVEKHDRILLVGRADVPCLGHPEPHDSQNARREGPGGRRRPARPPPPASYPLESPGAEGFNNREKAECAKGPGRARMQQSGEGSLNGEKAEMEAQGSVGKSWAAARPRLLLTLPPHPLQLPPPSTPR